MDRWRGVVRVTLNNRDHFSVAASLCISPSKILTVPSLNAIFFNGDRVEGTGDPVIERLSNTQNIAHILVSKCLESGVSVNAWVIEASTFNGAFAVYKEFLPSVNSWGDPKCYNPDGFPASTSMVWLLSKSLEEVKKSITIGKQETPQTTTSTVSPHLSKTLLFGFSKGGIVLNQLITELAHSKPESSINGSNSETPELQILPASKEDFLNSISEIHYMDVGLNSPGAYLTDTSVIEKLIEHGGGIRFVLHGTPRQWCDSRRRWIKDEKDRLFQLLENAGKKTSGRIQVCEKMYLTDMPPSLKMHFEIIELLDIR